jgi:hypothetical protein
MRDAQRLSTREAASVPATVRQDHATNATLMRVDSETRIPHKRSPSTKERMQSR